LLSGIGKPVVRDDIHREEVVSAIRKLMQS